MKNSAIIKFRGLLALLLFTSFGACQTENLVYKTIDGQDQLTLRLLPESNQNSKNSPCVILLSGGGWINFSWTQLHSVGKALAREGAKVFVVEYRTSSAFPEATPIDALADVQDAIFYLRQNAKSLKIDKDQIIAIGASAGAHLAFSSYMSNPRELSPLKDYAPNYIVGYSPVIRNDLQGYAYDRIGPQNQWFSCWNVYMESEANIPPTLVLSGAKDKHINIEDLKAMELKSIQKQDTFRLITIDTLGHSMGRNNPGFFENTNPNVVAFLKSQGVVFSKQ